MDPTHTPCISFCCLCYPRTLYVVFSWRHDLEMLHELLPAPANLRQLPTAAAWHFFKHLWGWCRNIRYYLFGKFVVCVFNSVVQCLDVILLTPKSPPEVRAYAFLIRINMQGMQAGRKVWAPSWEISFGYKWCWRRNILALGVNTMLVMHWLLKSPMHHHTWYWLYRTDNMYYCSRVNVIYFGRARSKIWFKMWIYLLWF